MFKSTAALGVAVLISASAWGQEVRNFDDWAMSYSTEGTPFILTRNDSGSLFGQWCDAEESSCYWILASQTPCKKGNEAPALVSAEGGVTAITTICSTPITVAGKLMYRVLLSPFDDMEKIIKGGARISFALAVENDNFRVIRYSLKGVSLANLAMNRAKLELAQKLNKKTTRDVTL